MRILSLASIVLFLASCQIEKTEIHYGEEVCDHCHMLIMDQRFGAEIVTEKGKAYKFDAMECLINFREENPEIKNQVKKEWTNIYSDHGELFDAHTCFYLRSLNLPSPMGMYINAFPDQTTAEAFQGREGGQIYSWQELNESFWELGELSEISKN